MSPPLLCMCCHDFLMSISRPTDHPIQTGIRVSLYKNICYFTFLYILILVKGDKGVILAKTTEGVDEMGAEVGVDVLGGELGVPLPVDRPVGVVADNLSVIDVF